ncbi:uncharacterized protein ARMOST_03176 [Armillaria ostoyae]|uniref:Uncharacterized protein n=1 Tax=Armillaria ostoyae TaxID=47428 RepID=A0A284QTQ5_ARMOS|nr:uncharacterized protein ARMOST_03176 [Armillaria ostoyae]
MSSPSNSGRRRGRPRKYHSEEEQKEAHAVNQARYYHQHKERLNEDMRTRYHASKPPKVGTQHRGPREKMVVIPTKMSFPKKTTLSLRMLWHIKLYDG